MFETIWNLKCEFWDVLSMVTAFHEKLLLFYAKTCFNRKWNILHDFWMKNVNAIQSWLVGLMESSMNEKFSSLNICALSQDRKRWSEWKVEFYNLEEFSHLKNLFENENFPKLMLDSLFLTKTELCSHTESSLSLYKGKMAQMRLKGSKYGVYIHVGR